jgi:hypothetical protein
MIRTLLLIALISANVASLSAAPVATPFGRTAHVAACTSVSNSLPRRDAHLSTMRAGATLAPVAVTADERATLRNAANRAPHLAAMRAGELSSHDWEIIGLTALVVIVLLVIF